MRGPAVVAVALLAVLAPGAHAAVPTCRLITDPAHDETPLEQGPESGDLPQYDVVSGDLASNATTMTAVIRVRALAEPVGSASYSLTFTTPQRWFEVDVTVGADAAHGDLLTYDVGPTGMTASGERLPAPSVVVDLAHDEVRASFPLASLTPYTRLRRGTAVGLLQIHAYLLAGSGTPPTEVAPGVVVWHSLGWGTDYSESGRSYHLGARSCVRVGA